MIDPLEMVAVANALAVVPTPTVNPTPVYAVGWLMEREVVDPTYPVPPELTVTEETVPAAETTAVNVALVGSVLSMIRAPTLLITTLELSSS